MSVNEEDLFSGFDEEEGVEVQTELETESAELTAEQIQEVEAQARAEQPEDLSGIDAFIEQQKVQTKDQIAKDKKNKSKTATPATSAPKTPPAPSKPKYTGPRIVMVYGAELFTEENPEVTNEDIRKRIVEEFAYPEFSKDRTTFSLDEETGILVPGIQFQKKG